jgi:hypothetical protein
MVVWLNVADYPTLSRSVADCFEATVVWRFPMMETRGNTKNQALSSSHQKMNAATAMARHSAVATEGARLRQPYEADMPLH